MTLEVIQKKLVSGFLTLAFRRALLYVIIFANTNLLLARILPPEIIGIYNIGNSILAFFTFFSDFGLAGAIIQKKELNKDDLKTTFTIQEILAFLILIVVWFMAPFFANIYHLNDPGMWLIRALGFGFFLTSLKVLPSVLLERNLKFGPLVLIEILETSVFLIALDFMVMQKLGVASYSYAVLLRGIAGTSAIYIIAPWKLAIGISKKAVQDLLKFGAPFQLNSILALLKDRLVALVVAGMIGPLGIGYVTWAQNIAFMPLEIMNIMTRITFPAFSRLQDDKRALKETLEKSIFFTSLLMYPLLFGVLATAPSLVAHVVRSNWQPALPMVYLFSLSAFWAALSTPFTNFLNATGKINISLKLMVMWTVLEWLITPFLSSRFGFMGVGISSALISFTSIIPIIIIKRIIDVQILKNIRLPLISAAIMGGTTYYICQVLVTNFYTLLMAIIMGVLIYSALMLTFAKNKLSESLLSLKNVSK